MFPFRNCFFLFLLLAASGAWGDFGNWFVANQRVITPLDSTEKKLSYRFTCQENMSLSAVAVYCVESKESPSYIVSLQEDKKGFPSGEPLAFSSYVPRAQSWTTIPLLSTPLVKGRVYHLVLEHDSNRGGIHPVGRIGPANFSSFVSTDTLNHRHPNDGSPDPEANMLLLDQGKWKEMNREPVYVIYGEGNLSQGNPYDDPGVRPIYAGGDQNDKTHQVWQGEALHFPCGFQAVSLVARVRKQGHPSAPLNYFIVKNEYMIHKCYPVHSAVFLAPGQVEDGFRWVTVGFDDARTSSFSPEAWYLVFQTDSGRPSKNAPGCEDCYLLSDDGNSGGLAQAADLTFDSGPHRSREVYSRDGGSPLDWLDEFERDANVAVLGPPCHSVPYTEQGSLIPTPEPLDGGNGGQP